MQNLQEVQQDVKQLEEQAKAEEKEIQIQLELETKLQLECEELKGYLVHNSENLRR